MDVLIQIISIAVFDQQKNPFPEQDDPQGYLVPFSKRTGGKTAPLFLGVKLQIVPGQSAQFKYVLIQLNHGEYKFSTTADNSITYEQVTADQVIAYLPFALTCVGDLEASNMASLRVVIKAIAPDSSNQVQRSFKIKGGYSHEE